MIPEINLPWWRSDRPWGFRFSWVDGTIVAAGLVVTMLAWPEFEQMTLAIPYLLGHFFLFCNPFRIGGERSLIWVVAFLMNVAVWMRHQNTAGMIIIQMVVTILLIAHCVMGKNDHGWLCERINPHRYRVGASSEGAFTRKVLLSIRLPKALIEVLVGRRLAEFDSAEKPVDLSHHSKIQNGPSKTS